jgi:hypothetical protein
MGLYTYQPTANETPDSSQIVGDLAVTGASNTGHSSTTSSASGAGSTVDKTCRWSGFAAGPKNNVSVTLKITHTSDGTLTGGTAANRFTLEYSINGGGAWLTAVDRLDMTSSAGPTTFSVALSAGQDLTQVQVRDVISALSDDAGDSADAIATISGIQIEVVTVDQPVVMM